MVGLSAFPNRGPVDETKSSQMSLGIVPSSLPASLSPRNTNVEPPILPTTQPQQPQQPQQQRQPPLRHPQQRRRLFAIAGSAFRYQFPANRRQLLDWGIDAASWIVEIVVYWLGPLLITFTPHDYSQTRERGHVRCRHYMFPLHTRAVPTGPNCF
jgi:hypothetical protein